MKLNSIAQRHSDSNTDKLYQPLRFAIQNIHNIKSQKLSILRSQSQFQFRSGIKNCQSPSINLELERIKQTVMVPYNMHLVQTNNPLKRMRARSKSYRAISIDQKLGNPLEQHVFKQTVPIKPVRRKEIVYDYQPNGYKYKEQNIHCPTTINTFNKLRQVRSASNLGSDIQVLRNRVTRIQSIEVAVRKNNINEQKDTPRRVNELSTCNSIQQLSIKSYGGFNKSSNPEYPNEYYLNSMKFPVKNNYLASPIAKRQQTFTKDTRLYHALPNNQKQCNPNIYLINKQSDTNWLK